MNLTLKKNLKCYMFMKTLFYKLNSQQVTKKTKQIKIQKIFRTQIILLIYQDYNYVHVRSMILSQSLFSNFT